MFTKNWINSDSFTKNSAGKPKRGEGGGGGNQGGNYNIYV